MYKKWDLTPRRPIRDPRFQEILDLLTDRLLSQKDLVHLILGHSLKVEEIAALCYRLQGRIDGDKPYSLLRQRNRELKEIPDWAEWLKEARRASLPSPLPGNPACLDFGENPGHPPAHENRLVLSDTSVDAFTEILLALWLQNADIRWQDRPFEKTFQRVVLPHYVFDRKSFWVSAADEVPRAHEDLPTAGPGAAGRLCPLLDRMAPELSLGQGMVFLKKLTRDDPVLTDHTLYNRPLFPAAGYLEMVLSAALALKGDRAYRFSGFTWLRPLSLTGEQQEVRLILKEEDKGLSFSVQSRQDHGDVNHAEGRLTPLSSDHRTDQPYSVDKIKSRCARRLDGPTLYRKFAEAGLGYGDFFQGVREAWIGQNEVLAALEHQKAPYILHPALTDGLFQTMEILSGILDSPSGQPMLPFRVENIEILKPPPDSGYAPCYAYGQRSGPGRYQGALLDERGAAGVIFRDVSFKEQKDSFTDFFYVPRWRPSPPSPRPGISPVTPDKGEIPSKTVLILHPPQTLGIDTALSEVHTRDRVLMIPLHPGADMIERIRVHLQEVRAIDRVYFLGGIQIEEADMDGPRRPEPNPSAGLLSLFRLAKVLGTHPAGRSPLGLQVITSDIHQVVPEDRIQPFSSGLTGLSKTIAGEFPHWKVSCLDISHKDLEKDRQEGTLERLAARLRDDPPRERGAEAAIRKGRSYVKVLMPLLLPPCPRPAFRQGGVYLIAGGAGGIGLELGRHLAETVQARLVLLGRSALKPDQEQKMAQIGDLGGEVLYVRTDIADPSALQDAVALAKSRFGAIHGVFHSALVLRDRLIINMTEEDFLTALAPKVQGSMSLYEVFRNEPLDFMIFFSSALAFSGNPGQGNYVAGCTFEDGFSHYLDQILPYPVKTINWGYWGSVGIVATDAYRRHLAAMGLNPIQTEAGLEALERMISNRLPQVAAIRANRDLLLKMGVDPGHQARIYPDRSRSLPFALRLKDCMPLFDPDKLRISREAFAELDRFGSRLLLRAFRRMGAFPAKGETILKSGLRERLGIIPKYDRLLDAFLNILSRAGFISVHDEEIQTTDEVAQPPLQEEPADPDQRGGALAGRFPEIRPHLRLMKNCTDHYDQILSGRAPATDVMFPNASMDLVEGIYAGHPTADWYNRFTAQALLSCLRARLPSLEQGQKVTILEVGAGTGGTTASVLEAIEPYGGSLRYVYTDVSPAFTRLGKERFGGQYPFMEFSILDVEKDVAGQGYGPGGVEVVFGVNVIHATRRIRHTLQNLKRLLSTNGWLVLSELTEGRAYATLTFGLLEGWWLFEDQENRLPDSPLLGPETWTRILSEEGFKHTAVLGQPEISGQGAGQHLIIAESDGIGIREIPRPLEGMETGMIAPPARVQAPMEAERSGGDVLKEAFDGIGEHIRETILENLVAALGVERQDIDRDVPFSEFGLDSITGVEVITRINDQLGIDQPVTVLFDYPGVEYLCEYLAEQHGKEIAKRFALPEKKAEPSVPLSPVAPGGAPSDAEGIAVIGISCRFPGAGTAHELWRNLVEGRSSIREVPRDRWDAEAAYDPDPKRLDKISCKWGGFLDRIDRFDPLFFNMSGREAEFCDPQQRIFLEECWKALEDAGYIGEALGRIRCGVFVGVGEGDYQRRMEEERIPMEPHSFWGNSASVVPARISYVLNLTGPSIAMDTACSSSLVAVHQGCQSILTHESDLVIAGGVFIRTTPRFYLLASNAGMLSAGGACRTFDDAADGFVPGEGAGVVILKSLRMALQDRDHIYGVIRGSGTNQDGRTNGITAPSGKSQTALELAVYGRSGIHPETISYVEAHGTGTRLGDPVEIGALNNAFRNYSDRKQFCAIGSIKTNIGHTAMAAGVAGLIKVLLSLENKKIPPSLHFRRPNRHINFKDSPFYVNTKTLDWPSAPGQRRRAALSSFGMSGTNAHMVIEEPPPEATARARDSSESRPAYLVLLSAKTETALKRRIDDLGDWLAREGDGTGIGPLAYTLHAGRAHFQIRAAIAAESVSGLRRTIEAIQSSGRAPYYWSSSLPDEPPVDTAHFPADPQDFTEDPYLQTLCEAAKCYVQGRLPSWEPLYAEGDRRRISLPAYPFEERRCWLPKGGYRGDFAAKQIEPDHVDRERAERFTREHVEEELIAIIAGIFSLSREDLDPGIPLVEIGLDSLLAVNLANQVMERLQVEISPVILFETGTIDGLVDFLMHSGSLRGEPGEDEPLRITPPFRRFPLSAGQKGMWLSHQMDPEGYAYHVPNAYRIQGQVDPEALTRAFEKLIRRHELLRAGIRMKGGEPVQEISSFTKMVMDHQQIGERTEAEIGAMLQAGARQPFDLEKGPLFRVHLFSRSPVDHILVITLHHIIFDGRSLPLLLHDLTILYEAERTGQPVSLPETSTAYADFVAWQDRLLKSGRGRRHGDYWRERLSGDLPVLDLPLDRPHPPFLRLRGEHLQREISRAMTHQIRDAARAKGVSTFSLLLSAFQVLLHLYTQEEDIIVGTPVAGRPTPEFEPVIGHFVNMVPIRMDISREETFAHLTRRTQRVVLEALEHGDYPFIRMVHDLGVTENPSRTPLFQAVFLYLDWLDRQTLDGNGQPSGSAESRIAQRRRDAEKRQSRLSLERLTSLHQEEEFDVTLKVYERPETSLLLVNYNPAVFNRDTMERLADHYLGILGSVIRDPSLKISETDMSSPEEKDRLLHLWNQTASPYPREKTIHGLFEEEVDRGPERIAVRCGEETLTYGELNTRANQLAHYLQGHGVSQETPVGIHMNRSMDLIVSLMGILKAGGAYVPIPGDSPANRIETLLRESRVRVLLTHSDGSGDLTATGKIEIIDLDLHRDKINRQSHENPVCPGSPDQLAYIMVTSGSTGIPKGVAVPHQGVVRLVKQTNYIEWGPSERVLQFAPISFDASTFEIWGSLLNGCELRPFPKDEKSLPELADFIRDHGISILWLTAGLFHLFVDLYLEAFKGVRQLLTGGEVVSPSHAGKFIKRWPHCRLINGYGPTENTTFTSTFLIPGKIGDRGAIPIGKPIANTRIYILDPRGNPTPQGVTGEIHAGGAGLARGYRGRPDLTAERFIPNPFTESPGERLYRTGDYGRWLPDGTIEFLGRMDQQVKIRGHRIELEEIETALSRHPGVKDAVVVAREDHPGAMRLAACLIIEKPVANQVLQDYLRDYLPGYMIPSLFIRMTSFPLTDNGKIDRRALPPPQDPEGPDMESVSPRTEMESRIAGIWREVLHLEKVGVHDNFFDMGGNSLSIVKVYDLLQKEPVERRPALVDLFRFPNIESLARHLSLPGESSELPPERARDPQMSARRARSTLQRSRRRQSR
ncbi:MAG: amino acid adenylation domain-containing protein [Pseudomonadota bacterium]